MIDINGDGAICVSELRNLVEKTGNSITEEELENMV
jgi:Ca2+-binding EF-hand superfamily protein